MATSPSKNRRSGRTKGRESSRGKRKPRSRWWTWTLRIAKVLLAVVALGAAGLVGLFWYYGRDLPSVSQLRNYEPPQTTRVLDRNGETIGEVFTQRRTVVPLERVPRVLVLSVLAAEDADFYEHQGLDYPGIVRAIVRDIMAGRPAQGASTITQQVVKLMLLTPERRLSRKIRELILARRLEQELEKEEILHLYLNHINFGHGRYGVQEAARFYFGKDVQDLTLAEASLIAGIPQAPARLSPRTHPEAARRRQRYVLDQLEAKRAEYWPDLTAAEIEEARNADVALVEEPTRNREAPEVLIMARRMLRELVGDEAYERGGYTIHTTIDLRMQRAARRAVQRGLEAVDERQHFRGPLRPAKQRRALPRIDGLRQGATYEAEVTGTSDEEDTIELNVGGHAAIADMSSLARYNPQELSASVFARRGARVPVSLAHSGDGDEPATVRLELGPQAAAVVIDPRTRGVVALVGGYENEVGFNRATQAVRQPGSTFKPFVYAYGIHTRELTPASIMIDAPAVYDDYRPQNYETWSYEGHVRLREAVASSINLVAIRVIDDLGASEVVDFAQQLGITTELEPTLSLALGSSGVRPIELTNAYASFAAGGQWSSYHFIDRVEGPAGETIALPASPPPRTVLSPAEAHVLTSLLTSVIESGTGRDAQALGHPAAGKTGTSNDARDAWFVGYTARWVAGVWVGFDDSRPLGRRESGGRTALPIWLEIMRAAHRGQRPIEFAIPSGIVTERIDPESGLRAPEEMENAIEEVFVDGTAPIEFAEPPDVTDPTDFLMEQLGSDIPTPEPTATSSPVAEHAAEP